MAVGFAAQTAAAQDAAFTPILRGAIVKAAEDIYSEATNTPGHIGRANLATSVIKTPDTWVLSFAAAVAATGVDKTSTDLAVSNAVSSVWNVIAAA